MIRIQTVTPEDRNLLWNISQKYLYEMTKYYPDDMDSDGNYHYGYFDAYFTEPERSAYFIYDDTTLVGFAMLNPYSYLGHRPDHVIAEFSIFPSYRRKHFAVDAANLILAMHPGNWEIKYNDHNNGARLLWDRIASPYSPNVYHISDDETVLEFSNRTT